MNVSRILDDAAGAWPGHVALVDVDAPGGRREFTYRELAQTVSRTAAGLRELGLVAGDRVAILLPNSWEYVVSLLAVWRAGCVAVPLNTRVLAQEHAHMVRDSGARLVIAQEALLEGRDEMATGAGLGVAVARGSRAGVRTFESLRAGDGGQSAGAADGDLASLFYTSGTTGLPKGVMLSHGAWRAISDYARRYLRYGEREVTIHAAPLTHGAGFLVLPTIAVGGVTLVCARFDPSRTLRLFAAEGVTNGFFVPSMLQLLLDALGEQKANAPAMKSLYYAGSPIDPGTLRSAVERFGPVLVQSFGQAECAMFLTVLDHDTHARIAAGEDPRLVRSAGLPVEGTQVRVVGDDDRELPAGATGEVVVRGPHMMSGYWNRPEATAETLRGGWVHTGDLGRFDEAGYLYIADRKKDMIISGGSNVYAREVEEALLALPGVREAAVIGLPHRTWGEMVAAVLVGARVDDAVLEQHCRATLADYRRPKRFFWIDELPRNAYGKVLKRELRERFSGAATP
ncbi:MAG: AMP-binding protein [Burkholderiales bacterium]|nr:AMP-binding protein [Burkholderiales bacterium]